MYLVSLPSSTMLDARMETLVPALTSAGIDWGEGSGVVDAMNTTPAVAFALTLTLSLRAAAVVLCRPGRACWGQCPPPHYCRTVRHDLKCTAKGQIGDTPRSDRMTAKGLNKHGDTSGKAKTMLPLSTELP
jgi:hypothetical protein